MSALRRQMKQQGAGVKVAKNRLAKRALEGTEVAHIAPLFKGPTVIAYSGDPVTAPFPRTFLERFPQLEGVVKGDGLF